VSDQHRTSETVTFDPTTWPRDPANGRLLCSPDKPMPRGAPGRWAHTNIESMGDHGDFSLGTEYDDYRCKDCGTSWSEEVPQ
jgi:hypothetical protein